MRQSFAGLRSLHRGHRGVPGGAVRLPARDQGQKSRRDSSQISMSFYPFPILIISCHIHNRNFHPFRETTSSTSVTVHYSLNKEIDENIFDGLAGRGKNYPCKVDYSRGQILKRFFEGEF